MENKVAAFDFDGSIAEWRRGSKADYVNPEATMRDCYSNPNLRWIALQLRLNGFQMHVITGRGEEHRDVIHRWLQFYGIVARIHCRPSHVALSCTDQAAWKASVLKDLQPITFIGDNALIDEAAARKANVPFVHVYQAAATLEHIRGRHDPIDIQESPIQQLLDALL